MYKLSIIILPFILTACAVAPPINLNNQEEIKTNTKVVIDSFKNETKYELPSIRVPLENSMNNISLNVRPFVFKSGKDKTYFLANDVYYYGKWRFYKEAVDSNGVKLEFKKISSDVVGCRSVMGCELTESVAVILTESYLRSVSNKGLTYRIYAGNIKHDITISSAVLKNMMEY